MGECPPGHTLERIDNDGDYEPGNCRWATRPDQSRNKRTNRLVEHEGKQMVFADFCDLMHVNRRSMTELVLYHGLTPHEAAARLSAKGLAKY